MTNWEKLLAHTTILLMEIEKKAIYFPGTNKIGDQSGVNEITLEDAFNRIGQLPGEPMLLVKTNKWGGKPGGFYAKHLLTKVLIGYSDTSFTQKSSYRSI